MTSETASRPGDPEPGLPYGTGVPATPPTQDPFADLRAVLDLVADPQQPDVFVGPSERGLRGRVFGGQVLCQSVLAACRTVGDERPVHSMHGYFLRPGDPALPISFAVERLRDGRSFSARRVHAVQQDRPILSMIASFQVPAEGMDHHVPMPPVPMPEELPTLAERYAALLPPDSPVLAPRPVELRHVDPPLYLGPDPARRADQSLWFRFAPGFPQDATTRASLLAYASDFAVLEPALRRHGRSWADRGLKAASLDHAMWWHREAPPLEDWLLYVIEAPSASGARGLGVGRIYTRDGVQVATVAQEGMLRVPS